MRVYRERDAEDRDTAGDLASALLGEYERQDALSLDVNKASRQLQEQVHSLLGARSGRAIEPFADPFKLNDLLFNSTWHARWTNCVRWS